LHDLFLEEFGGQDVPGRSAGYRSRCGTMRQRWAHHAPA
jgi:hypothetical protein